MIKMFFIKYIFIINFYVFLQHYSKLLANRLITSTSFNMEMEETMITKIKVKNL